MTNEPQNTDTPPPLPNRNAPPAAPSVKPPPRGLPGWAIALIVCGCILTVIAMVAILAALLLPALASAKKKAQIIQCDNNLKQVGLAFKVWAGDHGDQYPFNVSTNKGGTIELCNVGMDGLERNSWIHFQVMSNELAEPKILVCPGDASRQPAADFVHFGATNVSYLIHTGTNEENPETVLAICPIHNNVLYSDGSVMHVSKSQMSQIMESLKQHP
jgi:hypothetical protein